MSVHPREHDQDAVATGSAPPDSPVPGAAGDERHAELGAPADDELRHLLGGLGQHDQPRRAPVRREAVALIRPQLQRGR